MVSIIQSAVTHPSSPSRSSRSTPSFTLSSTSSMHLPSDYSFVLSPTHALPLDDYCLFWEHIIANDSARVQFVHALLAALRVTHQGCSLRAGESRRCRALEATLSLIAFHDACGRRTVMVEYNRMADTGTQVISGSVLFYPRGKLCTLLPTISRIYSE